MIGHDSRASTTRKILEHLIETKQSVLLAQAKRHSQLPADAEEALHSAYIAFLETYDPSRLGDEDTALKYLMTTVKRCAWAMGRRAYRRSEVSPETPGGSSRWSLVPASDDGPEELVLAREELRERASAFSTLKADEATTLISLAYGYSYREIQSQHGWTFTKVNRCATEGRVSLRKAMAKQMKRERVISSRG